MTTGGFGAITLAMKSVADPGDEVVYSLPPWFLYEALALEAGLVPVKVRVDPETFDLDLAAIEAAITARTRLVIVNSPNNPTGRIYPESTLRALADLLDAASARNGRRIYLISDEPYNRIVFDGAQVPQPGGVLPLHAALLLLRQDPARARTAAGLPGPASAAAGRRRSSSTPSRACRSRRAGCSPTR